MNRATGYRIGFLLESLAGCGAEKSALTLAEALLQRGHQVDLYLVHGQIDYQPLPGIAWTVLDQRSPRHSRADLTAKTSVVPYRLFICSLAQYHDAVVAQQVFSSVHITPTAMPRHSAWLFWNRWKRQLWYKRRYANKHLIALSEGIRWDLVTNLGCDPKRVRVIQNAFDRATILQQAHQPGPCPTQPYIVYVAALRRPKRHKDLIDAFALLPGSDLQLVLVGKGRYEAELRAYVARKHLGSRVLFWGWDANPYRLIKQARVSVLASESEGSPRVVIESLLLGTPTVSTDCRSGPNEILQGELARFLVPVGDVTAMAAALQAALQAYPPIPEQLLQRFDADQVAQAYESLVSRY